MGSTNNAGPGVSLFVAAGVATAPHFLDDFACELERRCRQITPHVQCSIHFPYGDWSRSRVRQALEISRELYPRRLSRLPLYGAASLAAHIRGRAAPGQTILLAGHSGGGVAAVQAADLLRREGLRAGRIVQIGAPKSPVPLHLRGRVMHISAVNGEGKPVDPVVRLGTWGGWSQGGRGVPRWDRRRFAPEQVLQIPIVGGHADYFRNQPPYMKEGMTNLERLMKAVWPWLEAGIEEKEEYDGAHC